MVRRRPKRPAVQLEGSSAAADRAEREQLPDDLWQRPRNVGKRVSLSKREAYAGVPMDSGIIQNDDIKEARVPFCCAVCRCSENVMIQVPADNAWINPDSDGRLLWHRRCCHGAIDFDESFSPPLVAAHAHELPDESVNVKETLEEVTAKLIQDAYDQAKREEDKLYNADGVWHHVSILHTNRHYHQSIEEPFQKLAQEVEDGTRQRRSLVVLDMFAGIGTAVVALKRLGLDISKVVHVEHDKIATHVYRYNHDPAYNDILSDQGGNVEHVYVRKFEEFEKDVEEQTVLEKYGRKSPLLLMKIPWNATCQPLNALCFVCYFLFSY
jgi:hypothetical protein